MNTITRWTLVLVAVAGLVIDAYTHLDLAPQFVFNRTSTVSEATLFRVEAGLAIAAAVLLVLRPRWWSSAVALAVAGGGLVLLVLYRYVDVGRLGPIPNMYEPIWFPEKTWSAVGEAITVVAALALLAGELLGRARSARTGPTRVATLTG